MKALLPLILLTIFTLNVSQAQYWNGTDSLYGNEWIKFDQDYVKFKIAEDGFYRLDKSLLEDGGVPVASIEARHLQFWHLGQQIPVDATTNGLMTDQDVFVLYAKKNKGEFDTHLFRNGLEDQLNPEYSLFTDTAAYFITWNNSEDGLRMTGVSNPTDNLPPVERFFDDELTMVFSQDYSYLNYCADDRCFLIFSNYDNSEGYAYDPGSNISNYTLYPKNVYTDGNGALLETRTTNNLTASASRGRLQVLVNEIEVSSRPISSKPSLLQNQAFVEMQEVFEGMEVALKGLNGPDDLHAISLMSLIYPRTFQFENKDQYHLNIEASIIPKHLYIEEFNGSDQLECWNITTGELIKVDIDTANNYRMRLDADDDERTIIIRNPETTTKSVDKLYQVNFRDYSQVDPNYIIVAHPQLFDDGSGNNWVLEYAQYRASNEGGNFTPVIVPITVLYDQFAYGIPFHPSAVRHFTQWFSKNWTAPQHMFLMGKGVVAYQDRKNENPWQMIPCFGSPGADVLLCSDNLYRPILPVGRIPVLEGSEIGTYLEKIKLHEGQYTAPSTFEAREWAKNAVHLSGGNLQIPFEISLIRSELDEMKNDIEDGMIGMTVHTFQKKTSGAVVVSDNQRLTQLINDGVSLVTYFGHSGVQLLDFQIIDNVNTLAINDKFHVFMAMGCYAGDIFHPSRRSYSETWTLADRRGSIATIANSSAGFIPSLEVMGSKIYENYGGKYYGQAIGLSIWDAVNQFLEENRDSTNSLYFSTDVELAFSLNICGDPAVKLITSDGPDLQIDATTVGVDEDIITIENDSFTLHFDVVNIGKVSPDSVVIRIEQKLPNDELVIIHEDQYVAPIHRDSLSIRVENLKEKAVGFNKINITIDALNKIQEWPDPEAENNNDLSYNGSEYCFFITSDDARPVYPEEFSIVGQPDITLVSSTSNSHTEQKSYLIEIDTTALFNSNLKKSTKVDRRGGLITWTPDFGYESNTVYYWRITPDSVGRGQYTWRDASFIYLKDEGPGWNQSHYYQFLKDEFDGLVLNDRKKRWEYIRQFTDLKIKNVVVNDDQFLRPAIIKNVTVDWEYYQFNPWKSPVTNTTRGGVFVTVYEPTKIESLSNPSPGLYGSINKTGNDIPVFAFETTTYEGRVALMQFLENEVPTEHYVVFMPVREPGTNYGLTDWAADRDSSIGKSIFDVLTNMGATQTDVLQSKGEVPYIFAYQMDNPDFPFKEAVGNEGEELELNVPMPGFFKEGGISSVTIGPASQWNDLIWDNSELNSGSEEFELSVIGLRPNGTRDTLLQNITNNSTPLSGISAQDYPELQLGLFSRDSIDLTSPQLNFWRINYASLPEVAVDLNQEFEFYRDTLQQGEDLRLRYSIANIGQYDTDSLLIHYSFINAKNQATLIAKRVEGLIVDQTILDELTQSTVDMSGHYRLVVTINPNMDQPELYEWNNSIVLPYYVEGDKRNPILDVTFDGLHILDGDLVSAKPKISIGLEDENTYLALNDTSLFELKLQYPGEPLPRKVSFSDPEVTFFPGTIDDNRASISIQRSFDKDGIYRLIVNAKDRSGNISGDIDYQVRFEIVTATSISEMINYPNPFSTSTKFVYTMTGDRSPNFYKIQIVTLSGKIVRELTQDDMGLLRVGKHMTDYVYDGTDEFGERLANGVYLYRFIARDENGDQLENRDVGISQYSKKGWSKMVILR